MNNAQSLDSQFSDHLGRIAASVNSWLEAEKIEALVIHAGLERMAFLDDQPYPFRPNPWFTWMAPVLRAPGSLILWRYNKTSYSLFCISRGLLALRRRCSPTAPWTEQFELVSVPDAAAALAALPGREARICWIGEPAPPFAEWTHNPARLLLELEQLRCRKSPYEVACLKVATDMGVAGHLAAEDAFREGRSELDIHLAFLAASRQGELDLPYGSIVALNQNAATLHYQLRSAEPPRQHHSLLIDAGASCRGYASDITRTFSASSGLFASLVDGMHRLQQELCASGCPWCRLARSAPGRP